MRVLVVEDEEDLVEALRYGLVRADYAVDVAYDLEEATQKLYASAYDLMVLDLALPDGDGFDLCRAVRSGELDGQSGADLRILMLTARDRLADRVRGLDKIARAAEEIQATDLSRRIRLSGPKDELRDLSDTIDSMLDRLDDAFHAQRRLIDDASHELRSPLAIIRANVDTVLSEPDAGAEDRRRAVQIVDRATTRMTRLVEDLLATARRSAPAFEDTDVDLGPTAREAAEEFDALAAARGLTIERRLPTGLPVIGDHDALRRAVANLLSNAVRLAPAGSAITVAAGRAGGWQWVAVKDAGPGIHADDQDRVFDRFWRGSESRRSRDRRTGLGLAIVRSIVEAHNGHVRLFSAPDAGSTFVLWFPLSPAGGRAPGPPPATDPLSTDDRVSHDPAG